MPSRSSLPFRESFGRANLEYGSRRTAAAPVWVGPTACRHGDNLAALALQPGVELRTPQSPFTWTIVGSFCVSTQSKSEIPPFQLETREISRRDTVISENVAVPRSLNEPKSSTPASTECFPGTSSPSDAPVHWHRAPWQLSRVTRCAPNVQLLTGHSH